ncbi:hypothetical protein KC340_g17610 [Hortaea werneckii]|nr:hypothetical protein KC342_g17874 [Hortaea werneckii]KAI7100002.1 hypothetical protein KC339_g7810 [Hortaea werneckii]KAI7210405.1 hypothetical protein KC365_g15321 [Hortaea werneckii]KAI7289755.1 hypothetical protein KC340_g17610 [Hortaea werneckii]KAI7374138.1 hypothetical protein KC328_g16187 [Hortaea werneckii]
MSAPPANKKSTNTPSAPGNVRRQSAQTTPIASSAAKDNATPNRSPSRATPQASGAGSNTAAAGVNRTRSVRNGAPVSARAAARGKPQQATPAENDTAMEDMKADMQAKLDELQEKLQSAEQTCSDSQKQATLLQHKLDEAHKTQSVLEEQVHEHTERVEELENEKRESLRARRELESIYESERAQTMKEREERKEKEEEMQASMQRMKETLAQREMRTGLDDGSGGVGAGGRPSASRGSSFRSGPPTPNPQQGSESGSGGQFAPPGGLQRSDSRSSSKLVMQKDKIIEGLRLELAEAQIKLVEVENMGGGRMQDLQRQMYEVKMQNARLMEENESFQLLLTERTLHGEFSNSEFLRPPSNAGGSRPPSRQPNQGGASLADELNGEDVDASFMTTTTDGGASAGISTDDQAKRLQGEISSLKDQNKALTLYINNIISRLLQHEQFETILDKTPDLMSGGANSSKSNPQQARSGTVAASAANTDKDLPPPPPPKDEIKTTFDNLEGRRPPQDSQPADEDDQKPLGFLQRAKSVMSGGGSSGAGNRSSRPRPVTQVPSASEQQKLQERIRAAEEEKAAAGGGVTENPDTAPRVPLGGGLARGGSVRGAGGGGHRRANSDWNAAGLVGSMFKGASSSSSGGGGWGGGPLSPGLTSPTGAGPGGRNSFFGSSAAFTSQQQQSQQQPAQTSRVPSGGAAGQQVPTISETEGGHGKENAIPSSSSANPSNPTTDQPESEPSTTSAGAAPGGGGGGNSSSSTGPSSPPRSTTSSGERDRGGAVMMGSKPRPLRLVQEAKEDEAASKKANRGSWFGWMNKGGSGNGTGSGTGGSGAGAGRSVSGSGNGDA